jgi:hypothetical protein
MNRYIIQYHSSTLAALSKRAKQQIFPLSGWIFNYPNIPNYELKIALIDHVKKVGNSNLHTGLNIITDLEADSEEEAKDISKIHAENLLNLISFSSVTYCDAAKLVSIINITDKDSHPLSYYVYPFSEQEIISGLRVIDQPTFSRVFEAYDKSSHQSRTLRALTWLRKGIGEANPLDEFICYWTALEVIKGILRRNLRHKIKNPREWYGIKVILTDKLSFHNFDNIKETRRRLFHGGKEEDKLDEDFVRRIKTYLEPMRKTIIFGIGSIWDLEEDNIVSIANKTPRRIEQMPWTTLKGNLKNLQKNFNELVKNYPTFEAEITNKQISISQEGNLQLEFKLAHHFHATGAVTFTPTGTQLWGKKDSGVQQVAIKEAHIISQGKHTDLEVKTD